MRFVNQEEDSPNEEQRIEIFKGITPVMMNPNFKLLSESGHLYIVKKGSFIQDLKNIQKK